MGCVLAWAVAAALAAAPDPELVVGPVRGGSLSTVATAFVREGEPLTLAVAIRLPGGQCLAARAGLRLAGRDCDAAPADVASSARWFAAVPEIRDYDNVAACPEGAPWGGCHASIRYREVGLNRSRGALVADAAAEPMLRGPGARRIGVRVSYQGRVLAAPRALSGEPSDSTVPAMLEVAVRTGDDYVGHLAELIGVPFALFPATLPGLGHQTDRRLAADCVALVVYGRRRLGEPLPYVGPAALPGMMDRVGGADRLVGPDGAVADPGRVRVGDVLHFGFQTAVLYLDRPPLGRLDASDLVIHTYHGAAEVVRLGDLPYRAHAVEVLRWR